MNSTVAERLMRAVDLESNLLPFLALTGWERVDEGNPRWVVVHGHHDSNGRPLELVFPRERSDQHRQAYILKAIDLLTALRDEPLQMVLQRLINYDRDLLCIRNIDADEDDAIPLGVAAKQVSNLKRTIDFSACSERVAKPYFASTTPKALEVSKAFRFGHTFAGSFGFTVAAPRLPDPTRFLQIRLNFDDPGAPPPVAVPFERRVVERIARGLLFAREADESGDGGVLLREYASGFNSNMCAAVAAISRERGCAVEFRIAWSPKVPAGDDLAQIEPVRLRKAGCQILDDAARQLKALVPEPIKLNGHVRGLTASDDPLSPDSRRAVVIRGLDARTTKRMLDVVVDLEPEDYAKAHDAHIRWRLVQISGILTRSGSAWRLSDPRGLKILE